MASRRLGFSALLAVFACLAAGLRLGEQPSVDQLEGRLTPKEHTAREAGTCGTNVLPVDLARREGIQADCDEMIPHYDMAEWVREHGWVVPDHPAVFTNTGTHEAEVFPSMEAFLQLHGEEIVVAMPEYAQSGGHLKDHTALGRVNASFRDLAKLWNDTFVYFSDFKCSNDSLCERSSQQFGAPALFATHSFWSKNFLVGGPDSGLPFHKHGMTWQGLSMGRKAWYVLPPGTMTEQLHDETGPYLFPVRAYHGLMVKKKLGQRPLYCVQHPGEVVYVPHAWWHATMNLDRFQVAYGEKPVDKAEQTPASSALARILAVYPQQPFDSAGYTSQLAGGPLGTDRPMPYSLQPRISYLRAACASGATSPEHGFDEPLRRMEAMSGSQLMTCGAAETAAFAHCVLARNAVRLTRLKGCNISAELETTLRERAKLWVQEAAKLSPALAAREWGICHA